MTEPLIKGVSFFTNCYKGDWEMVLKEGTLEILINSCNYSFAFKGLIINNVLNRKEVEIYAQQAVDSKIIDAYYFSEDYSTKILSAFSIDRNSFVLDFHDGYWYSMGPLAATYLCKTEHLLYFTCDCLMQPQASSSWIDEAIDLFEKKPLLFSANPIWNYYEEEARDESIEEDENWFYGFCFSDQCFLVKVEKLLGNIYGYYHLGSEIFPTYAGNLFERRIDSYMRNFGYLRMTHKTVSYIHDNELKSGVLKKTSRLPLSKKMKRAAGNFKKNLRFRVKSFAPKQLH